MEPVPHGDRGSYINHRGHEFILALYHFPSSCEVCSRPLWDLFKPPPALECRCCHAKFHKDHLDKKENVIVPCKGQRDSQPQLRILYISLLLCRSPCIHFCNPLPPNVRLSHVTRAPSKPPSLFPPPASRPRGFLPSVLSQLAFYSANH
uniref:Phorbol-ester/DAG-type domain-containing protein n=1 Tax=Haplochromis burtoni TaxID=8153 RepID=A0A3Q2VMI9_HAPBU